MSLPEFTPAEARLEAQYQELVARFYHAQADFYKAQRESTRLRTVVRAKQEVITVLLPYYPHPLTPELQAKINLT